MHFPFSLSHRQWENAREQRVDAPSELCAAKRQPTERQPFSEHQVRTVLKSPTMSLRRLSHSFYYWNISIDAPSSFPSKSGAEGIECTPHMQNLE